MYISHLEHASFNTSPPSTNHSPGKSSINHSPIKSSSPLKSATNHSPVKSIGNGSVKSLELNDITDTSIDSTKSDKSLNGILVPEDACRAVYALSSAVDHLFDMAATTLPVHSFRAFLKSLIEASHEQLFGKENKYINLEPSLQQDNNAIQQQMITMNTLHLYHICDVMLRCSRNNNRPLLHVIEAWSIISSHLVDVSYSLHI